MDYSYRAMCAILAATGDSLTASEFSTIEHLIVSKVKVSDYKGVKQGIYYTLADGRIIRKFKSETGINYELVRTIPANRHKPKEPEKSGLEKATDGVKDTFVKAGEFGATAVKETADFLILDDVNTVIDPKASTVDRVIAGASIIPHGKILKLIRASGVIKFANKGELPGKRVRDVGKRPSWRQSEKDVGTNYPDYEEQKSFKKGKEVPYGTSGSSRPDFYTTKKSIEVKNYNVTTSSGRSRLINNVVKQVNKRIDDLPKGTTQTVIIDVRGQHVSNDVLRKIRDSIREKSGENIKVQFMR